jgi:hypothetical protein
MHGTRKVIRIQHPGLHQRNRGERRHQLNQTFCLRVSKSAWILFAISRTSSLKSSWGSTCYAWVRLLETGTYVLRVFLTKGCDLPPGPSIGTHDRISLARELAFVSNGVFQHEELTYVELVGFVSDGEEVRYGHWEDGLRTTSLFGLDCFNLGELFPQWNHGS